MNKIFFFICCFICAATITVHAQTGNTGNLTWTLSNNTLTISGSGAMPNYAWSTAPWISYITNIYSVVIGNGVTSIGNYAFQCPYTSYITSVSIPNSVTSVGTCAFFNCYNLMSIDIPEFVGTIGDNAFSSCTNLSQITNRATTPQTINANVFSGVNTNTCVLKVPKVAISLYEGTSIWKEKNSSVLFSGMADANLINTVDSLSYNLIK